MKLLLFFSSKILIILQKFPNIKKVVIGDGRKTNLPNYYFDIVHSNATIEHVGSQKNQLRFIKKCIKISKNNEISIN